MAPPAAPDGSAMRCFGSEGQPRTWGVIGQRGTRHIADDVRFADVLTVDSDTFLEA
jgi:hypothetical protein